MPGGSVRARVQGHGGAHGGSSNEKACDIARGGGACAGARRIYLEFQHRLGLGLAPLLPLLRRVHAPLPVRLLSLLALPASLGWLRLVLAEPLHRNFGKCADQSVEPFALKSFEMSASLSSRASAAGEISVRCATRVSASAESRTRSWRGSSLPALLSLPAIQSSPFSSCIGIVVPDSTSRTLTGGYPTVASLLERHASITMSRN